MRGAPNRRPKAAISPAPRCWLRKTSTGFSAKASWIHAKVASSRGCDRSTPRASVPSASPSGRSSGVAMDDPPSLVYSSVYAGSGYASNRAYQECRRSSAMQSRNSLYKTAGVDTAAKQSALNKMVERIKETWPAPDGVGTVKLDIGYFANVIDIGGIGLAFCTDGVGSKSIIAQMTNRYDTIGIDCVAMNVNDAICVGARPISMVDYIAVETADAEMLGAIAIGLAAGAKAAGISICGGETAPLKDIVRGFDLVGTAVGIVPLDRIITGRDLAPGDVIIGLESSGIHSNGLTLARHVFFERAKLPIDHVFPELGITLGEELLRPTLIYVPEILEIIGNIRGLKALINITGDGLLNLPRVDASVGFLISDMPPVPPIFRIIQQCGDVGNAEMFEVYNMGVGFCVLVAAADADSAQQILQRHGRRARVIGRVIEDDSKGVYLPHQRLEGHGKEFRAQ